MEKNIKEYLHLYLGCECKGKDGSMIYTLQSVDLKVAPLLKDKYGNECVIFDFKPILRPLSDMTEDEDTDLCAFCLIGDLEHKEKWDSLLMSEAKRTAYLLSKHFDLFGLIESGLAIDATTLKNDQVTK